MRKIAAALLCLALAACGNDAPKSAQRIDTPHEQVSRVRDITIRANVLPTAQLNEAMARAYGIERGERKAMLLISVRQGPDGQDTSLPATVQAAATNLHGQRQEIVMREVRTGELIDYVGTADASPPDTLSFDIKIVREGAATETMTFSRDFAP